MRPLERNCCEIRELPAASGFWQTLWRPCSLLCSGGVRGGLGGWYGFRELSRFRGTLERDGGGRSAGDDLLHFIEVSGTHETLVLHRAVVIRLFAAEFLFLQARIGGHPCGFIAAGQLEHGKIQRMKSGEGDEQEFVSHGRQFLLEAGNRCVGNTLFPVE